MPPVGPRVPVTPSGARTWRHCPHSPAATVALGVSNPRGGVVASGWGLQSAFSTSAFKLKRPGRRARRGRRRDGRKRQAGTAGGGRAPSVILSTALRGVSRPTGQALEDKEAGGLGLPGRGQDPGRPGPVPAGVWVRPPPALTPSRAEPHRNYAHDDPVVLSLTEVKFTQH